MGSRPNSVHRFARLSVALHKFRKAVSQQGDHISRQDAEDQVRGDKAREADRDQPARHHALLLYALARREEARRGAQEVQGVQEEPVKPGRLVTISLVGFIAANLVFGILSGNVIALLADGLTKFV